MKHLFVPYELALKLKEKGFDERCFAFCDKEDVYFKGDVRCNLVTQIPALLYQQVVDWFREKHNIVIELTYASNIQGESGFKYHLRKDSNYNSKIGVVFPYYKALTKAIEEALKLI